MLPRPAFHSATNMVSALCISLDLEAEEEEEEKLVSPLGECNRFRALLRWGRKRVLLYLPVQSLLLCLPMGEQTP